MSPGLQTMISKSGIGIAMGALAIPFIIMIPIVIWMGKIKSSVKQDDQKEGQEHVSMIVIIKEALKDRDYRLILVGFATCGFNMSIIESHLFSQFISYGISSKIASLTLTVYGIATMIGAVGTGFLGIKFRMKNVLGSVYAIRVIISLAFIFLPKTVLFAFAITLLLGFSGDSTVPPTSGIISQRFGSQKMAVLYGFAIIGHQIGAFVSSYLGGLFVKWEMGYMPLWVVNACLAAVASIASFSIHMEKKI